MRNLLYKRVVIFFLVFCLCAVMPQYTQAEETAVPAGEQETTVPEPITKTKTVKTAFSGVEKKHNYSISATIKDGISVTHPQGRKLYLQRYDSKNKKWVNAMTYSLNVQDAPQSVKVTYPAEWKKATYTSWRFYVPETTVSDAVTDNTPGQVTTTVMKYQAAASKTVRIIAANRVKLKLSCKRAVVMDQDGNILYTKNGSQRCSQASVTKLMTLYLAYESKTPFNKRIRITKNAYRAGTYFRLVATGGRVGDRFKFGEMTRAVCVSSANDAAEAIGDYLGGSEAKFAKKMTAKASALGMKNTRYKDASGLAGKGHYTTAKDQAILLRALHRKFGKRFKKDSCRKSVYMHNLTSGSRNKRLLTRWYSAKNLPIRALLGAKTGTTSAAGTCLASIYKANNKVYYVVNLGSNSDKQRFSNARVLYKYARKYGK